MISLPAMSLDLGSVLAEGEGGWDWERWVGQGEMGGTGGGGLEVSLPNVVHAQFVIVFILVVVEV